MFIIIQPDMAGQWTANAIIDSSVAVKSLLGAALALIPNGSLKDT